MKRTISALIAIFFIFQALSLFSCSSREKNKYTYNSFDYFDTVTSIIGYAESEEDFKAVREKICDSLSEYHKLYDIYHSYDGINNLYTVNHSDEEVTVDQRIIDLLLYSKQMYQKSEGTLNIAMGSVLSIWHRYREHAINNPLNAEIPPEELLLDAAEHTDIESLIINEETMSVRRADTKMTLDVGAIAKGYAVERIAEALEKESISGYLINVGGNVRALGIRGDGSLWKLGIENPDTQNVEEPYIAYLTIESLSLVTSGNYQRFYEIDGVRYHHIIDPKTLFPSEYYMSVSVLCKDSGLADALSTTLFSTEIEKGRALIESIDGAEAMWVMPNGEQLYSSGFESYFEDKK